MPRELGAEKGNRVDQAGDHHRRPGSGGGCDRLRSRDARARLQHLRYGDVRHRAVDHHQEFRRAAWPRREERPDDICFVFNFRNPEEPCELFLKAGAGSRLRDGMADLIDELSESVPGILADREFRSRIERAVEPLQRQEKELVGSFEKEVAEAGFSLVQVQAGMVTRPEILPVVNEQPVPLEKLGELVEQGVLEARCGEELTEEHGKLTEKFRDVFQEVGEIRRMVQDRVEDVRRKLLQPTFDAAVDRVRRGWSRTRAPTPTSTRWRKTSATSSSCSWSPMTRCREMSISSCAGASTWWSITPMPAAPGGDGDRAQLHQYLRHDRADHELFGRDHDLVHAEFVPARCCGPTAAFWCSTPTMC